MTTVLFYFLLLLYKTSKCCVVLTDLGNFSGRTRSAVSVREGQGVVLMCSPPPHSPGTVAPFYVFTILMHCLFTLGCDRWPDDMYVGAMRCINMHE